MFTTELILVGSVALLIRLQALQHVEALRSSASPQRLQAPAPQSYVRLGIPLACPSIHGIPCGAAQTNTAKASTNNTHGAAGLRKRRDVKPRLLPPLHIGDVNVAAPVRRAWRSLEDAPLVSRSMDRRRCLLR